MRFSASNSAQSGGLNGTFAGRARIRALGSGCPGPSGPGDGRFRFSTGASRRRPVVALVLDELRQRVPQRASPLDPRIHRHLEPSGATLDRLQQRHRGLALVRPEPRPLVVVAVGCVVTSDPTGEAGALAGPTARNWER